MSAPPTPAEVRELTAGQRENIRAVWERASAADAYLMARHKIAGDPKTSPVADVEAVPGMTELLDAVPDGRTEPWLVSAVRWAYLGHRFGSVLTDQERRALVAPWDARG